MVNRYGLVALWVGGIVALAGCRPASRSEVVRPAPPPAASVATSGEPQALGLPTAPPNIAYEIAPWFLFYDGALSLTFDGNDPAVLRDVVPLLTDRERPIRSTFYVVTGSRERDLADWPRLRAIAAIHEIGSRTVSDSYAEGIEEALRASRERIEQEIPGQRCLTVAYPHGLYVPEAVRYYLGGRLQGKQSIYADYPKQPMQLADYHIPKGSVGELEKAINRVLSQRGWGIVTYGERGEDFAEQMDTILHYHSRLWDAPVADVLRYIKEAQTARLFMLRQTEETLVLQLTDLLPEDDVFNHPLSIEIALPDGWQRFTATQAGKPVWHGVVRGKARFNAVPDGGEILLRKTN